ncbi:hypothetical protein [Micromonospora eburnea]|uniref:Uncharacterized protein n=1 Tax=Micromonospora eburnea TaxID=227316 RepID=A0A1C6VGF1_9ACTN|nr:hypothetical protein [Micromonospora eburnea]SCL65413.1 hypothetical protein GA0070604_5430 [Micromonospora eburnea]
MATRPGWQRMLVPFLLIAAALVLPVVFARQAIAAERVTVRVESCDLSGPKATQACRGSWRLGDGRVVSGPVDGTQLRAGTEIQGWGNGERATSQLSVWLVAPVLIGGALLVGLGAFGVVWVRLVLRSRRAGGGTTGR